MVGDSAPIPARTVVVAIGGNALILDGQLGTIEEQSQNARATATGIAQMVADGWRVVVTHGNGPQVGFILLRSEMYPSTQPFVPKLSLEMCVADSQGGLGYIMTNALENELGGLGLPDRVVCVLTQSVVDRNDPAFEHPTKAVGPAFTAADAEIHRTRDNWIMMEDSGRGYRRVVASPRPRRIVETAAIRRLLDANFVVVACGGGGIPVVEAAGRYHGIEAVVDKDLASATLAASLRVPLLVISTGVERVAIRYRQLDQRWLDRLTVSDARRYLEAGEFPPGSMGPKMRAAIEFIEQGGAEVIITSPSRLREALNGETGTHVVPD